MNAPHVRFVTVWSFGLPVQFGDEIGPIGGEVAASRRAASVRPGALPATLTSTTGRPWRRNASASAALLHDFIGRVRGGKSDDAFLQVDDV